MNREEGVTGRSKLRAEIEFMKSTVGQIRSKVENVVSSKREEDVETRRRNCYLCNSSNHLAYQCPSKRQSRRDDLPEQII